MTFDESRTGLTADGKCESNDTPSRKTFVSVCRRSAELMLHIWVIRNAVIVFVKYKTDLMSDYRLRQIAAENGEQRVMFKPMVRTFTRAEQPP